MSSEVPAAPIASNAWARLRGHTSARIGLPRVGVSLATSAVLEIHAAHAAARDAVWAPLDRDALVRALNIVGLPVVPVASRATDRRTYLMRPDLGRALDPESAHSLGSLTRAHDLAIVVADGLSANAAQLHAAPLIATLLPVLGAQWRVAPLIVAEGARVALGDEIAIALGAKGVLVLIGERPGLSATDSLGAYLTWGVKPGLTDADRNCVSNIRPKGVDFEQAAHQIAYLLSAAREKGYSGVMVKNRADEALSSL